MADLLVTAPALMLGALITYLWMKARLDQERRSHQAEHERLKAIIESLGRLR